MLSFSNYLGFSLMEWDAKIGATLVLKIGNIMFATPPSAKSSTISAIATLTAIVDAVTKQGRLGRLLKIKPATVNTLLS
jgi:hypothetical protein